MPTYTDFIVYHPAFTTTDVNEQAKINRMLANLDRLFPASAWEDDEDLADQALFYYVCHLLTLEKMRQTAETSDNGVGSLKRIEVEKQIEVEYHNTKSNLDLTDPSFKAMLSQTACGRELIALDDSIFRYAGFVVGYGGCS